MFYAIQNKHKIWFTLSKLIITDKEYNNLSDNNKSAYENLPECPKWLTSYLNVNVNKNLNNDVVEMETAKKLMEFGISTPTKPKRNSPPGSGAYASFKPKHQVLEQVPVPEQIQEEEPDFNLEDEEYEEDHEEEHYDEEEQEFELPLIEASNEIDGQGISPVDPGQVLYGSGNALKNYVSSMFSNTYTTGSDPYIPQPEQKAMEQVEEVVTTTAWKPYDDSIRNKLSKEQEIEQRALYEYRKVMKSQLEAGSMLRNTETYGPFTKPNKI